MKEHEKIYLDKEGYNNFLQDIEHIKEELSKLRIEKAEAYRSSSGDDFHDNFAFEDAENRERGLLYKLSEKLTALQRVVIIQNNKVDDIVEVNDVVSLTIDFGEKQTNLYRLSGTQDFDLDGNIINVSINSPLGKAIYLKKIGESVSYNVKGNEFKVQINSKIEQESLENRKHI